MMTLATPKVSLPKRVWTRVKQNAKRAFSPLKLATGAGILAVDQTSKLIACKLSPESIRINPGTAFGIDTQVPYANQYFACLTTGLLPIYTALYIASQNRPLLRTGFGLLIAGSASNLIDRLHAGGIIDFIPLSLGKTTLFFNLADGVNDLGLFMIGLGLLKLGWDGLRWIKNRFFPGGVKNVI
jgi:lipoprotein signal peptidase